jgi:sortase A
VVQPKPPSVIAQRLIGAATWFFLVTGAALAGFYLLARIHSAALSRVALGQFSAMGQTDPALSNAPGAQLHGKVNFGLWSLKRITAYQESLSQQFAPPLAVLDIPRIGLEVPVFNGTDDLTLNRGVGRISGTAHPGQGGNLGIAGHRDGFFRCLKDVVVGDHIELRARGRTEVYQVDQIRIVKPTDIEVLENRGVPTLTLVTCYPFYFIGNAPQRYIVRATESEEAINRKTSNQPNAAVGKIKNQEKTP